MGFAPTFYFAREKMGKESIENRVRELAQEVVQQFDLELVHSEVVGAIKNRTVKIFIDKEAGVTHEDCAKVSTKLGELIDIEDFIPTAYILEVSSPGLERGLYRIEDFGKFAGRLAQFKTYQAIEGQKNFVGRIVSVEDDNVVFEDRTNGVIKVPYPAIAKANLQIDLEEEFKKAKVNS